MSRRRYELADFEWSIIEPLLPNKPRGVPRVDDRRVLTAIRKAYDGDIVMIDSSCVRVHQHGASGKKGALSMAAWAVPEAV
ncbi:transposase [Iodidimonas nitroreducens]|uniref:Transposase n=1 Tax=Iodidimonas nitroreducens TaxID=1236968 RepID=A0A5A7N7Q7_9PROT|nr:transposase [Iodidimonas nitroreducens]